MNKSIFVVLALLVSVSYGQVNEFSDDIKWTFGFGVNIVDNDGFRFDQAFDTDNWNFKKPYSLDVGRKLGNDWSVNLGLSVNTLTRNNLQNNGMLDRDRSFVAIDVNGQYNFDQHFMRTPRIDPFEAYGIAGFGYTRAVGRSTTTFNFGLGFNFWIIKDVGIRLRTLGKFGFNDNPFLKNYIQHTAEFIVRF